MTTQEVKRKLVAILSADVKGYSRLMGEDELGTIHTLNTYKEVMAGLIQHRSGRVVDAIGDNLLAEFGSVVDAVQCAVEIQKELKTRNADLAQNRRMEFRIGVNLGDVVAEKDRIFGDGVNIAARIEKLSEAGGICISGTVFDHVENKLGLRYEYLGEQIIKNIAKPVRAYRVLMEIEAAAQRGSEVASEVNMAFPLPDKPSIAVLPFVNMSEDPKQEFLCDGITEEIITDLCKSPYLFVIARQSSFAYKGKPVKIKQVSEELGVRYVLEGSVRRSGDKVRITAQLVDAMTGYHLWAERYDRELKEIFALQDEIGVKIMRTVHERLQGGAVRLRVLGKGTGNIEAFLKLVQARVHFCRETKEDNAVARRLNEEAIALDPNYSIAYVNLAWTHIVDILGGTSNPMESLERAIELGQKAVALDESEALGHSSLGYFYTWTKQFDRAVFHAERALALDRDSFAILFNSGATLTHSGRPKEAIPLLQKAVRLNPLASSIVFGTLSVAYSMAGRFDEAMEQAKRAVERNPKDPNAYLALAATCIATGREKEARAAAAEVLKIYPAFSVEEIKGMLPYKDKSFVDRSIYAWRKAGLK